MFSSSDVLSDPSDGVADELTLHLPEEAFLVRPTFGVDVGVLVLLGYSGRMDLDKARLLARHGAHAMALRWFGGTEQSPGVCEIPLEVFVRGLDRLKAEGVRRLAVVGLSKGAEAALLLACVDDRVDLTVAMSPPSVVWGNVGPGLDGQEVPYRSSWTWRGEPLPFVEYDESWVPAEPEPPYSYRSMYEKSLALNPTMSNAAAIPIEQARGDVVLVGGGADELWPSVPSVRALARRRLDNNRQVEVIINDEAGHSPLFPQQAIPPVSARIKRGGTPHSDAELGAATWAAITQRLGLI